MDDYKIKYLKLSNSKSPLMEWLKSLDSINRKRIQQRFLRLEQGNLGDYKAIDNE